MKRVLFFLVLPLIIHAQEDVTPQQIQRQLQDAELQYQRSKEMFNPWYTGPLVTPSPTMMPPGSANIQPYIFVTGDYASFNEDRKSIALAHNIYSLKSIIPMQIGITDSMDFVVDPSGQMSWSNHKSGGGFGDLSATIGFAIFQQSLYVPGMKFTISETFPTGKYKNLSTNGLGLNATGGGAYQTQFGFAIGKVVWWTYPYPMNTRFFIGYNIPTDVHVSGFNTYGGGFGTSGKVSPGNTLTTDFGFEFSFTQRWVFALDVVYVAQDRTKFHGTLGTDATGAPAVVGGGYNDNLSLAPAIEYNWNGNFGVLGGAQFSVYGRNSFNFVTGQFSLVYTW